LNAFYKDKKKWYYIPIILMLFILLAIVEFTTWASVFDYIPQNDSQKKVAIRILVYLLLILISFLLVKFILFWGNKA